MRTPAYYRVLSHTLEASGLESEFLHPLGFRTTELGGFAPKDFANCLRSRIPTCDQLVLIGHSWGGHLARALAATVDRECRLFEVDSRITPATSPQVWADGYPSRFAGRQELIKAYATYGVEECDIDWTLWLSEEDGSFRLNINLEIARGVWECPEPILPLQDWPSLQSANPTYFAALGDSFNTETEFTQAADVLKEGYIACPWLEHCFEGEMQERVAKMILAMLG